MGARNPERDRLWASDADRLEQYRRDYVLSARCRRCDHARDLPMGLLLKAFGPRARLDTVASRLRCQKCQLLGAKLEARYLGPRGDTRH